MNQITTQYVTENGACYEQYVITDPAAKTSLTITPERGGMITGFTLDGDEYIKAFGEPEERTTIMISAATKAKLSDIKAKTGKSFGDIVADAVAKY